MEKYELSKNVFRSQLKPRARLVLNCLIYHCNKDGECFPSLKTIAAECGYGLTTVKRALGDLVEAGYITKQARFDERKHGGQTSNLYSVQTPAAPQQEQEQSDDTMETPHILADQSITAKSLNDKISTGDVSGLALSFGRIKQALAREIHAPSHIHHAQFFRWPGEQATFVPP